MRLKVTKIGLRIIPETDTDIVYIERLLGLQNDGESIKCVRKNAMGLSIAELEIDGDQKINER